MKPEAARMQNLAPYYFAALEARLAEKKAAGCRVIRLDIGSPDLPPAPHIVAALARSASQPGNHGYQSQRGPLALRQAWADHYRRSFQVELDPQAEILPLMGSKEGIFNLSMAWVEPGEAVLIPDPGYVTYTRGALFAGGRPFPLPLCPERGYLPDLEAVPQRVLEQAKILWLNYPNNPTGSIAPLEFFEQAVAFARRYNLLVCHDAAYTEVTYDGYQAPSLLQAPGAKEVAVEFNSLSKTYNMAGWRAAAALGNPAALQALYRLKANLDSGHFLPVWEAATAALNGDQAWLEGRNAEYRSRRDLVVAALDRMGLKTASPRASLYVWAPVPAGWSSGQFCEAALDATGVSLAPGIIFGKNGEGFVRISLTSPTDQIGEAMQRLEGWVEV